MEPSFPMSSTSTTRHHYSSLYDTTLPNVNYDSDTIYHNPWLTTAHNSPVHDQLYPPTNPTHISHPTLSQLHQLTPMSFATQDLMTSSLSSYRRFSSTLSPDHFLHTSSPTQPAPSAPNTPQHHFSKLPTDVNSNNSTTSPPTTMTHLHDCPLDDGEPVSPSFHPAELASPPNSDEISEGDINKSNTQPTTNVSPTTNTAHTGLPTTVDAVAQSTAPQPASATPAAFDAKAFLVHDFFTSPDFTTTIKSIIGAQVKQHLDTQAPTTPVTTATSTTTGNSTFASHQSKPSFASVTGTNHPTPPPGNIWTTTNPAPATTAFPPLTSPTAPSTHRLHPKSPPTRNPPPPGFTHPSSASHPPSNTPPLQIAISELRNTTSSIIHVNCEHYRAISAVHPNPSTKIGETIASSINQVLLHHSPSMASVITCTNVKRAANANDNLDHIHEEL
eukprot:scaffold1885_cov72-Skeletonema_dohrnii-CCMP3373.AAC.3